MIIKTFIGKSIIKYINLCDKKVNEVLFEKSLLLLDLQAKAQRDAKSNIK